MAITKEQWEKMVPGKVKIIDGKGCEWQVIEKLKNEKHPSFMLQVGISMPVKRMLVPNVIYDELGIVDQAYNWAYGLNLPSAKIVKIKKREILLQKIIKLMK